MNPMDKFTRTIKGGASEPDPFFCRHFRSKSYVPDSFAGRGGPGSSPALYWCLKTMRPDGPDGASVLPEACTDERACFEPAPTRSDS